jgi:UDP-glucose/iron transport system ATP-binding protein
MTTKLTIQSLRFLSNGPYSLELAAGECCGISGASGVGKSQFLRAVADVLPHTGDCALENTPCFSMSPQTWRKQVALVPAESFWWYDTVEPHFGTENHKNAYLCHLIERLGFSLDVLKWQISRLSTGEWQRLSLIRTLITNPKVLLLDEPTSGLDNAMAEVVESIVATRCLKKESSCLWVSHDQEQLARISNRCFQLSRDALVEMDLCM